MSPETLEKLESIEKDVNNIALAYLRVSTGDQSTQQQHEEILYYAKTHGFTVKWILVDDGISGAKTDRKGLNEALELVRSGQCKIVIVRQISRLGRSFNHVTNLLNEFQNSGVRFIAIKDGVDTKEDSPMTRAYMRLLSTFAELYREMVIMNTQSKLDSYKRQIEKKGFYITKNGEKRTSLGRPHGSKDGSKVRRKKSGYLLRWQKEKAKK